MQGSQVLFHVHSWRCGHAEDISDQTYIEKAIEMGADSIVFTDHAPFPGNPFKNRMNIEQLSEYITTLSSLKDKYIRQIVVHIGLEMEYLPSFDDYYESLLENSKIELLLLGQHHFEIAPNHYSFEKDFSLDKTKRTLGIMMAQIRGIESGYFKVIAHPDRCMRDLRFWDDDIERISKELIAAAIDKNVILERNSSSMRKKNEYWPEFWNLVPPDTSTISGCDAHYIKDLQF